jgi:tetratricopeptide (TPR) repeat protein
MMLGACGISRGVYDKTLDYLERSRALFAVIGEAWGEAFALSYPGLVYLGQGAIGEAITACEMALAVARRSGDRVVTHQILLSMAEALEIPGNNARAAQLFSEGLHLAITVEDVVNLGYFVKGIGVLMTRHIEPERGLRLLGAAEALLEAVGVPFHRYAPGQEWYNETLVRARVAIGPAAFAQAWAAGRVYSIEQAKTEAEVLGEMLVERLAGISKDASVH